MTNALFGKLALALSLATVTTMTVMIAPSSAEGVKKSAGQQLKVEAGSVRTAEKAQTADGGSHMPNSLRLQRRGRPHNLISGKVNKHTRGSIKQRAHNLVSGKVKKTNRRTGTK